MFKIYVAGQIPIPKCRIHAMRVRIRDVAPCALVGFWGRIPAFPAYPPQALWILEGEEEARWALHFPELRTRADLRPHTLEAVREIVRSEYLRTYHYQMRTPSAKRSFPTWAR